MPDYINTVINENALSRFIDSSSIGILFGLLISII